VEEVVHHTDSMMQQKQQQQQQQQEEAKDEDFKILRKFEVGHTGTARGYYASRLGTCGRFARSSAGTVPTPSSRQRKPLARHRGGAPIKDIPL
jgi:hypothetical protein